MLLLDGYIFEIGLAGRAQSKLYSGVHLCRRALYRYAAAPLIARLIGIDQLEPYACARFVERAQRISIHAPHERGDSSRRVIMVSSSSFQSTPRMNGATR